MEQKNVAVLATLLNKPVEEVSKAIESEDGLVPLINDFNTNYQVFTAKDLAKMQDNLKKITIENLKEEDIPESFKNKAVGWKLGDIEEQLTGAYNFDGEYKGVIDLVEKIVNKSKSSKNNDEEVALLKKRIVETENEWKDKLNEKQKEFDSTILNSDFKKAMRTLDLNYEEELLKKQQGLLKAAFDGVYKIKRENGKTVVYKGEEVLQDNKLDPKPLNEVLLEFAKDYGFQFKEKERGGHGGGSSKSKIGLTGVPFAEYLESKGVKANTDEADKLFNEWKTANS